MTEAMLKQASHCFPHYREQLSDSRRRLSNLTVPNVSLNIFSSK
jgi:hypothetical protein